MTGEEIIVISVPSTSFKDQLRGPSEMFDDLSLNSHTDRTCTEQGSQRLQLALSPKYSIPTKKAPIEQKSIKCRIETAFVHKTWEHTNLTISEAETEHTAGKILQSLKESSEAKCY